MNRHDFYFQMKFRRYKQYITLRLIAFVVFVFISYALIEDIADSMYRKYSFRNTTQSIASVDFMTKTSGFCGQYTKDCIEIKSSARSVRVGLIGWASEEFNLGTYACATTNCILFQHEKGDIEYDTLISSRPPRGRFPSKHSLKNRHVELNIESSANTHNILSFNPFAANVFDLAIGFSPPQNKGLTPFMHTSYINSEIHDFLSPHDDHTPWLGYEFRHAAMVAVISNCWQINNNRLDMLKEISNQFSRVYKFGNCFDEYNAAQILPETIQKCLIIPRRSAMWDKQKECILKNVMFSYSIENSFEDGYITEKLWQALKMGAIPVYSLKGVPENRNSLPHPDSALIIEDFSSMEKLTEYMHQIAENKTLWFKHAMKWRYLPITNISQGFLYAVNNSLVNLPCRVCDWWLKDTSY